MTRTWSMLLVLALTLAGCMPRLSEPRGSSSNVLTQEQLNQYSTVGAAVAGLRSTWLVPRSTGGLGLAERAPVWVYRDNVRLGSVTVLANLPTSDITRVNYLDARAAQHRYGVGHENGVIQLTYRMAAVE
jgi:hypothetical protein